MVRRGLGADYAARVASTRWRGGIKAISEQGGRRHRLWRTTRKELSIVSVETKQKQCAVPVAAGRHPDPSDCILFPSSMCIFQRQTRRSRYKSENDWHVVEQQNLMVQSVHFHDKAAHVIGCQISSDVFDPFRGIFTIVLRAGHAPKTPVTL